MLVLGVGVARALTLSVAEVSATPGQVGVSVSVKADNAKGIAGGDMMLTYDAKVLTAKQVQGADLLTTAGITVVPNLGTAGQVKVSMAGAAGISSGSGALVNITFDVKAGAASGTYPLELQADLSDENGVSLPVTVKKGSLTVKATSSAAAPLTVSAKSVGFDSTQVGSTNRKTLTLTNTGSSSLSITKVSIGGTDAAQFKVTPSRLSISSKGSQNLTLTFAPTSAGAKSASLTITYSGAGSPVTVSLSGKGIAAQAVGLQISVGSGTGTPGSTVAVPISVNSAKGIAGGDLTLSYNAQVLRVKEVKGADLLNAAGIAVIPNTSTAGKVLVAMAGATGMSAGNGALLNMSFEVLANAVPGTYELKLEAMLWDENGLALPATTRNGALTIKAKTGKVIGQDELPATTRLLPNYPNPFNSATVISYQMANQGVVRLAIYDLLGQWVRVLADRADEPGIYEVSWDGLDDQGQQVSSGMYLYHLAINGRVESRRMLLLK